MSNLLESFSSVLLGDERGTVVPLREPFRSFINALRSYESAYARASTGEVLEFAVDYRVVVPTYVVQAALRQLLTHDPEELDRAIKMLTNWTTPRVPK